MSLHSTGESTALRRQLDEEYADVTPDQPKLLIHTEDAPASTATDATVTEAPSPLGSLVEPPQAATSQASFATRGGCPETIEHDPRESGDRLYTAYYKVEGAAPGVLTGRAFASSPKDYLAKMNQLERQRCVYTPMTFERQRLKASATPTPQGNALAVSQMPAMQQAPCPLWRNVMLAMIGAAVGVALAQQYFGQRN